MAEAKKKEGKKVSDIIINVVVWVIVAFSAFVTIMAFSAQGSEDGVPEMFGKSLITIQSPSMTPTYKVGDMVIITKLTDEAKANLKEGDIITYHAPIDIDGDGMIGDLNTHRIEKFTDTGLIVTKGDNNDLVDDYKITRNDVIGISSEKNKIAGLGAVMAFLCSPTGFLLCVVLPLALFFLYELYHFISLVVSERAKKTPVSKETEEEIKRRAIEEYLRAQKADAEADSAETPAETPTTPVEAAEEVPAETTADAAEEVPAETTADAAEEVPAETPDNKE